MMVQDKNSGRNHGQQRARRRRRRKDAEKVCCFPNTLICRHAAEGGPLVLPAVSATSANDNAEREGGHGDVLGCASEVGGTPELMAAAMFENKAGLPRQPFASTYLSTAPHAACLMA